MAVSTIVICGPTASGKSALALEVARRTGGEILSADSMQVYRGMDIGTAKPTAGEQAAVRHHLIDLVEPSETYTVAQFVEAADRVLAGAAARGVPVIVTGGTPLYYKALFEGLFEGPAASEDFRRSVDDASSESLHARLRQVDPAAAQRLHVNDRRRLVRAIEVFELTGKPLTDHQQQWGSAHRHAAIWFGLNWDKDLLNRRINARAKQMIAAGWVDETRRLIEAHGTLSKTAGEATGYAELIDHLHGKTNLEDAVELIKIATRQLGRRQMKWFRRWQQITWLDGQLPAADLADAVVRAFESAGPTAPR